MKACLVPGEDSTDTRPGSSGQQEPGAGTLEVTDSPIWVQAPWGVILCKVWPGCLESSALDCCGDGRPVSLPPSPSPSVSSATFPVCLSVHFFPSVPPSLLFLFLKCSVLVVVLQDPSSPTKDRTHAACIGHGQSYPPDLRGGPCPPISSRLCLCLSLSQFLCLYIALSLFKNFIGVKCM